MLLVVCGVLRVPACRLASGAAKVLRTLCVRVYKFRTAGIFSRCWAYLAVKMLVGGPFTSAGV